MINELYIDILESYSDIIDKYTEIHDHLIKEEQDYLNYMEED